jgi:hypothetical protein
MTELDAKIRTTVVELLEAAPPPPPMPRVEMTAPAHRPRRRRTVLVLATVLALVAATVVVVSERSGDEHRRVVTAAPLARATLVRCDTAIGAADTPEGRSVVLGRAALSTHRALQANHSGSGIPVTRFFAKDGLLVRGSARFDLIVPAAWRKRLRIAWGGAEPTTHLRVPGCRASTPGQQWLVFAGGYSVPRPACVPLIVKNAHAARTVHIGVGASCPGQGPPPAGD